MRVSVTYWEEGRTVTRTGPLREMPSEGVLWVRVDMGDAVHVLKGADRYWIHGHHYGVTHEDAVPRFGGRMYAAWAWVGGEGPMDMGDVPPESGACVLYGVELPDDVWARVEREGVG